MKILFLVPYPTDEAPSQRFRFEQYFNILTEAGHTFTIQSFIDQKSWRILYLSGYTIQKAAGIIKGFLRRGKMLLGLHTYDRVFIHREASPIGPPVFEWLITHIWRKKVIYDFDDAIWIPNTSATNRLAAHLKWHHKVADICKWSYRVSCGNDFLANWAAKFNDQVVINPTTLDTDFVHNRQKQHREEGITIGWTGTHSTLKYLEMLEKPLLAIHKKFPDIQFLIISNQAPTINLPNLVFQPWNKTNEVSDLLRMDIGIMPLTKDAWSEGKCGFKALQYMSLGIPTVASPVGVNQSIIQEGKNGYLATTEREWIEKISELIESPELRRKTGLQAHQTVIAGFSVRSNRTNFLTLFA